MELDSKQDNIGFPLNLIYIFPRSRMNNFISKTYLIIRCHAPTFKLSGKTWHLPLVCCQFGAWVSETGETTFGLVTSLMFINKFYRVKWTVPRIWKSCISWENVTLLVVFVHSSCFFSVFNVSYIRNPGRLLNY